MYYVLHQSHHLKYAWFQYRDRDREHRWTNLYRIIYRAVVIVRLRSYRFLFLFFSLLLSSSSPPPPSYSTPSYTFFTRDAVLYSFFSATIYTRTSMCKKNVYAVLTSRFTLSLCSLFIAKTISNRKCLRFSIKEYNYNLPFYSDPDYETPVTTVELICLDWYKHAISFRCDLYLLFKIISISVHIWLFSTSPSPSPSPPSEEKETEIWISLLLKSLRESQIHEKLKKHSKWKSFRNFNFLILNLFDQVFLSWQRIILVGPFERERKLRSSSI